MPGMRLGLAALAAALSFCVASAAAAPLAAYGQLPSIEQAAISPDGQSVALIVTQGDQRLVVVENLADGKVVRGLKAADQKVRSLSWAGNEHLLLTLSDTESAPPDLIAPRQEWLFAVDINVKTGAQGPLLHGLSDALNAIAAAPVGRVINGHPYAFVQGTHFVANQGHIALFKVDLDLGRPALEADASEHTVDWLVGSDGKPLAESEFDPNGQHWTLRVHRNGGWRTVKTIDTGIGYPGLAGLGRDGRSILLSTTEDGDDALRELAPDAADWGEPFAKEQNDEDLIFDPATGALIGVHALVGDEDRYSFYDPKDQAAWNATLKAYPGDRVTLQSMSDDHKKWVVLVDSPTDGAAYALVDLNTAHASWIGAQYNAVSFDDVSPVRAVSFKAKDGLALTGYLTVPHGKEAKNLPLVVFPHGGPAARDEPGFDWWAQAMASHGYAVLQVNYRGSDGFGWDFLKAGFGEWGRKMQTDLSDGVRDLAAQGIVDPKRVCIVGASYGGYAALAGATLDPGVYRCAVDVAGISDLRRFVLWARDQTDISSQRYWDRFTGAKNPGDPHLAEISPVAHADADTAPILLIHGKDDTVVPFEQSQIMAEALKKAGKPVDFVVLNHEDHWLSRSDTRLQMLQATIDFLEKHNPPG